MEHDSKPVDPAVFENLKDIIKVEAKVLAKSAMDGYREHPDNRPPPPDFSKTLISKIFCKEHFKVGQEYFDVQYRIYVGEEWEKLKAEVMVGYEEWLKETL